MAKKLKQQDLPGMPPPRREEGWRTIKQVLGYLQVQRAIVVEQIGECRKRGYKPFAGNHERHVFQSRLDTIDELSAFIRGETD